MHVVRELDANVSADELLAVVPYLLQHRSMTEAAAELAIPFARIRVIVEQTADINQPGLLGVQAFEVGYRNSSSVRIRPQATVFSQPRVFTTEETATLLLVLETIEDSAATTFSEAVQTAATKFHSALGTNILIIDSTVAEDGKSLFFSEQIYSALYQRKVLKARYWNALGQATVHELDCVNVYTVEPTTYLRVVDRVQEDSRQKSFRVDRLEAAEALDIPAGSRRAEPVDIRDLHASGAEAGTSEWVSVLIDADAVRIVDYEPAFFTENREGQGDAEDVFDQGLGPSGFSVDVPMSDLAATVSFVLCRSPSVTVTEPLKSKNVVAVQARGALAEYGRNDKA